MVSSLLEGAESCQGGEVPPPPGGEVPRNVRDAMAQKNKVDLFGPFLSPFFFGRGGFGFGGKYLALLPATVSFWILNSII